MDERTKIKMARNNKFACICHAIEAIIIILAYILEIIKGSRTLPYVLFIAALALIPVLLEVFAIKKDPATKMVKHILGIGFAIFYTAVLFTAQVNLVFVYVIPMLLVISVFNDKKYVLIINFGIIVENILMVAIGAKTGGLGFQNMAAGEIQALVMVIIAIYSYFSALISEKNEQLKVDELTEEKQKTERLLNNVMNVSAGMSKGIDTIYESIHALQETAQATQSAMGEVMKGSAETADAVQQQLLQTQEIENKTISVDAALERIKDNMRHTMNVLEKGQKGVQTLVRQVESSVEEGSIAAKELENLDSYIDKMNSIVELINGVASQTSLLALNASIEAARAGEAGKGFSVVATEISSMANQTQNATGEIANLIESVASAVTDVVNVVKNMISAINDEKDLTENAQKQFMDITDCTEQIRQHIETLMEHIQQLTMANQEIAQSIQTISAVSEEVSAHSSETFNSQEENALNLEKVVEVANELKSLTENL